MSDLLAPLLFVTQNEVESFWCLTGFMELVVSGLTTTSLTFTYVRQENEKQRDTPLWVQRGCS